MLRYRALAAAFIACAVSAVPASKVAAQAAHYHVVKRLVLGHTRADYIIVDPDGRRLYGLGDMVIDVDKDTVIGTVEGGGGGYAIAHDENRGFVRSGVLFDLKTLAVTGHVDTKGDGIRYDPVTHRAFTWEGKDAWVVDMKTGTLVTHTDIGDGLESGVADGKGKLFLNVEDSGFVERVDAKSYKIEDTYKIPHCGRAQGFGDGQCVAAALHGVRHGDGRGERGQRQRRIADSCAQSRRRERVRLEDEAGVQREPCRQHAHGGARGFARQVHGARNSADGWCRADVCGG